MARTILFCCLYLALSSGRPLVVADPGEGQGEPSASEFVRIDRDEENTPTSLDAAIVRFVPKDEAQGVSVDLISAIHVAEPAFFAELNRRFAGYDAVLYELVAPEGTRIPKGGIQRQSAISLLQGGMTSALGLSFQLDEIDYTRPNFVHADMTPDEFAQSMRNRDESVGKMLFRAIGQAMAKQSGQLDRSTDIRMLTAMLSDNREHELKLILAEEFADLGGVMAIYEGPNGSTLVTERNKKALAVLKQQFDAGKKRLAIFYGAGHMQDIEKRLVARFGMQREGVQWLRAWDLRSSIPATITGE